MIGLGILAAGAAQGAANASNMNVQAQNQLEMEDARHGRDMQRDALREEYLNKRFDKEVAINQDNAKAAGALRDMEYQRNRADKIVDNDAEFKRKMQIEGVKESGRNARTDKRIAAMKASGNGGVDGSSKGITLENGKQFIPSSPEYRLAMDMVNSGEYDNINDAIRVVISKGLLNQSASSPEGLLGNLVTPANKMTNELFNSQGRSVKQEQSVLKEWNPKTRKFE